MSYDLIKAIEQVAPTIATALTSPMGGIVTALIEKTLGVSGDALTQAVQTDPDAQLKLKQLEFDHADALAKQVAGNLDGDTQFIESQSGFMQFWLAMLTLLNMGALGAAIYFMFVVKDADTDHALIYLASTLTGTLYIAFRLWFRGRGK